MEKSAKRSDWKTVEFSQTIELKYVREFSPEEMTKIRKGVIPEAMEDKWFIFFEDQYLYFYRSWTGIPVYRMPISKVSEQKFSVDRVDFNADLPRDDDSYAIDLFHFVFSNIVLGEQVSFPVRSDEDANPAILQHHISGTGYKSEVIKTKPWWKFW